ncbi:uncharacterized protein WM277_014868 isoform 2-T2 [Molossus nigricans]
MKPLEAAQGQRQAKGLAPARGFIQNVRPRHRGNTQSRRTRWRLSLQKVHLGLLQQDAFTCGGCPTPSLPPSGLLTAGAKLAERRRRSDDQTPGGFLRIPVAKVTAGNISQPRGVPSPGLGGLKQGFGHSRSDGRRGLHLVPRPGADSDARGDQPGPQPDRER